VAATSECAHHLLDVDVHSVLGQSAMVIKDLHEPKRVAIALIAFVSPGSLDARL
jgi:hypothetical protein